MSHLITSNHCISTIADSRTLGALQKLDSFFNMLPNILNTKTKNTPFPMLSSLSLSYFPVKNRVPSCFFESPDVDDRPLESA